MAGFEVIVRPVVFPNIRPAPARSLAPEDNPEQGIAVLSGSSGTLVDLSRNESGSWSRSRATETKRQVQPVRIYQQEEDGTINRDNFVDTERMMKVWTRDAHQDKRQDFSPEMYLPDPGRPNIENLGPPIVYLNSRAPASTGDDRAPSGGDGGGGGGGGE